MIPITCFPGVSFNILFVLILSYHFLQVSLSQLKNIFSSLHKKVFFDISYDDCNEFYSLNINNGGKFTLGSISEIFFSMKYVISHLEESESTKS